MAKYKDAIEWMAENDDTSWINTSGDTIPSVTACLVADLFGKPIEKVVKDLEKYELEADQLNSGNC